jgi:GH25 family lysozyme M1 (1,4-beta-N-acetylmuramidase)
VGALLTSIPSSAAAAAPAGYPVTGIDVSAFQGSVSWAAIASGGARFAYLRASEQASVLDSAFAANMQGAKANGLYVGAYHRARPDVSSGIAQADFFSNAAVYVNDGRSLPPLLDIESPRTNWTGVNACYNLTPAQLTAWIKAFVDEVARRTGRQAMIYTNTTWWNTCTNRNAAFGGYPLFVANYSQNPPPLPPGWTKFTFWQYSPSGSLPGDQDVFNGTLPTLTRLAGAPAVTLLARANGRYVTAENAGQSPLIANRTAIGPWEQFDQIDVGGGYIALRAHANGRYVTAESGGDLPLIANRTALGAWEKFQLIVDSDGSVGLLANANGRYVTAPDSGTQPLVANRTTIRPSEEFLQILPASPISLMANAGHRYVSAENAGQSPLIANRTAIGPWETFDQFNLSGGFVALRARANGKYVTAENAGGSPLIANRTSIGPWEKFRLVANPDGSFSLMANADGKYVTAESAGRLPLIANRTSIGPWEKFYRTPG